MKRIVSMLLIAALSLSLFACEGKKSEDDKDAKSAEKVKVEEKSPVEKAKDKLEEAYESCLDDSTSKKYLDFGYDKMSLVIDTNPDDSKYNSYETEAIIAIMQVNTELELPSSLMDKMSSTRALDGMQTQNCGEYTVTWTYHPDNGLKVIYEVNLD